MAVREGSAGGYSERNFTEEANRKRRKEEEHRETKKRKAEKIRCKFCSSHFVLVPLYESPKCACVCVRVCMFVYMLVFANEHLCPNGN